MNPIDERIQSIKKLSEQKDLETKDARKHFDMVQASQNTQETILRSFQAFTDYLDNRVSKTAVVNQLREIGTPDALKVIPVMESIHETLKTHKNVDMTDTVSTLKAILEEAKKLPKELPQLKDIDIPDTSKQLEAMAKAISSVEKAIKAQKLTAEAPVVNVPETQVKVDAPDLEPLKKEMEKTRKEFKAAIKAIVIPEFSTKDLEKHVKKTNKLLDELLDNMPSGGGGGGLSWISVNQDDIPVPIQLENDGSVPVTVVSGGGSSSGTPLDTYSYIQKDTAGATYKYYGYADANSAGGWAIKRITIATNLAEFAIGATDYTTNWTGRAGLSYSDIWSVF